MSITRQLIVDQYGAFLRKHSGTFRRELGAYGRRYINGRHWLDVAGAYCLEGNLRRGAAYLLKAITCTPLLPARLYGKVARGIVNTSCGRSA